MLDNIGVIGAGQMGNGIAHVVALSGRHVRICDVSLELAEAAIARIEKNLHRQVSKDLVSEKDAAAALARIEPAEDLASLSDRDLVIEAAVEDEGAKIGILQELYPLLGPDALIATNTSSISITRLAAATDRPEKFIGMHFMNPVPIMKLVEVIPGIATDESTFEVIRQLAEELEKIIAISEDFPGFIVNRILMPMINEAIYTLHEGVGGVEAIDRAMRLGANHPMGPLTLADFIGLDTCLAIMQVLHDGLADSKYRPCPLLVKYVEAGWLGRKAGRGFYDYRGDGDPVPTR